jgi:hypothetical protein
MAVTFNIQFRISVATKVIRLTDTSSGFTYGKGCFKVEFPNGVVRNLPDFSTPDISTAGNPIDIPCEVDASGNVVTGTYIISYAVINNLSAGQTPLVRTFNFNWIEPANGITNFSDVITPEVVFKDLTSYSPIGSFTGALTRTITGSFPSTSEVSGSSPVTSTSTNTVTVVSGANYYEGVYTPTSAVSVAYTHTSNAWLTILYTRTFSKTFDIRKCPNQLQLVQKINAYRVIIDAYKETNDTQFNLLSEQYDLVIALYSHLIARFNTNTQDGSETILRELLSILEPYTGTYTYQSTKMLPFELTSSGSNSFNISDGTNTDSIQLGSTLTFASGNAALVPIVTNNNVTYSPTFGTLINTFAQGNDARFHNPVTIGTANGLSISTQALSLAAATTGSAGAMTASDKTKLDGIASGATANVGTVTSVALTVPAAFSVSGSPITTAGTLAITAGGTSAEYITGAGALATLNTANVPENTNLYFTTSRARTSISLTTTGTSGAATYDNATGIINIPNYVGGVTSFNTRTGAIVLSGSDVTTALSFTPYNATNPAGYISSITSANVTGALGYTPENSANKGIANGYASLDGGGLVPSTQLPSYVDDVLEFANLAALPATGETGKIYVALDTNKIYRWSGATYIEVSPTVGTIWGGITGTLSNQTDLQNALNAKQDDITLTTTGTSGAATFISNTLNIPNYAPNLSGYVPYTGATTNVNLGTHSLTAADLVINHVSGSGVAASITKGGSGEALTVVKTSGSGNAASITGGVTLLDELHLNTDLADAYIASATNWNTAYTNRITSLTVTGSSGSATLVSNVLNIPTYTLSGLGGISLAGTETITGQKTFNPSVTAASALAQGVIVNPILVASANSDVLVGLDINPTFTNGAFTGVQNIAIRTSGDIIPTAVQSQSLGNSGRTWNVFARSIASSGLPLDIGSNISITHNINGLNIARFHGTTGNLTLQNGGTFTDAGFRLDVAGTTRFQGTTASDTAPLGSELAGVTGTGTNWALAGGATNLNVGGYVHTVGSVVPLTTSLAAVNGTYYQITYTITGRTAGSITIAYGGSSLSGVSATGATGPLASSTAVLTITPTTDFDGTVVLSIKTIGLSSASSTFANSAGTSNIEVRASSIASNTFIGVTSGRRNTTGTNNTFIGVNSGANNTTGNTNSFFGVNTGTNNTTGIQNTFVGANTGQGNTTGGNNTFIGQQAGVNNTTGSDNSFFGLTTGLGNTTGNYNVFLGRGAGFNNTTGSQNTIIGYLAGRYIANGSTSATIIDNSIMLGHLTKPLADNQTNQIVIGYNSTGLGSNTTVLGNSSTTTTAIYGNLSLGSTVDAGYKLDVTGTARVTGVATFLSNVSATSNTIAEISSVVYNDAPPTAGSILVRHARGLSTAPTALQSGDRLGAFIFSGYNGSGFVNPAALVGYANENLTGSANGSYFAFETTAIGATSRTEKFRILGSGNVIIQNGGTFTDAGYKLDVTGTARVSGVATFSSSVSATSYNATTQNIFAVDGSERMRITATGLVGIGTSSPANTLDVQTSSGVGSSTASGLARFITAGTTTAISVGQSNSARRIDISSQAIKCTGDDFYLNNGGANATIFENNGSERMRISSAGNVLIGTSIDYSKFCVFGNIVAVGASSVNGLLSRDTGNNTIYGFVNSGNGNFTVTNSGVANVGFFNMSTGAYVATSDINKKKDFEDSKIGLQEVLQLKPTLYRMKTDNSEGDKELGFIAQDVKGIIPSAYQESEDLIGLNFNPILAAAIKAIQEQQVQIQELSTEINLLKNK